MSFCRKIVYLILVCFFTSTAWASSPLYRRLVRLDERLARVYQQGIASLFINGKMDGVDSAFETAQTFRGKDLDQANGSASEDVLLIRNSILSRIESFQSLSESVKVRGAGIPDFAPNAEELKELLSASLSGKTDEEVGKMADRMSERVTRPRYLAIRPILLARLDELSPKDRQGVIDFLNSLGIDSPGPPEARKDYADFLAGKNCQAELH